MTNKWYATVRTTADWLSKLNSGKHRAVLRLFQSTQQGLVGATTDQQVRDALLALFATETSAFEEVLTKVNRLVEAWERLPELQAFFQKLSTVAEKAVAENDDDDV